MDEKILLNRAYFVYLIQEELKDIYELDIDDLMLSLEEFLLIIFDEYCDLFPALLDFSIENGELKTYEDVEWKDKIRDYLYQIRNGNDDLIYSIDREDEECISRLVDLFVNYYRLYIKTDEECNKNLKMQALFYFGVILGLGNKKDKSLDGFVDIHCDDIKGIYIGIRDKISNFIASLCFEKNRNNIRLNKLKKLIPFSIENGVVNLVTSDNWDNIIINYLDKLQRGDVSLFDEFSDKEKKFINDNASLFLDYLYKELLYEYDESNRSIGYSRKKIRYNKILDNVIC